MNKDTYKRKLVRMWNTLRDDRYKNYNACNGVSCSKCPLHDIGCSEPLSSYEVVEIVKRWSEQHPQKKHIDIVRKMPNERPQKKHKISQLEYDILSSFLLIHKDVKFSKSTVLCELVKKGYFKGNSEEMKVRDYLENCEVKEDV